MSITAEERGWLYRVLWEAPPHRGNTYGQGGPAPGDVCDVLLPEMARYLAEPALDDYEKAVAGIDELCAATILKAFREMGWKLEPHSRFSLIELASELGIIDDYHPLLERLLEILVEEAVLRRENGFWEVMSGPAELARKENVEAPSCPPAETEITLLTRCGPGLAQVLRGKCSPLSLLFPEADMSVLSRFYRESPCLHMMNGLVDTVVQSALKRMPPEHCFRILEIGAGTGGLTSRILPGLCGHNVEYLFTDMAHVFLNRARDEFKAFPFVQYGILDIEKDPRSQMIEPHRFDLVIAANVLHATRDLRQTLLHVRQMLAPGGMLVLLEADGPDRFLDLTFGLTAGWWRFRDRDLRASYPLIPPPRWKALLEDTGFVNVSSVSLDGARGPAGPRRMHAQSLIVAEEPLPRVEAEAPGGWLIFADKDGLGLKLKERLISCGETCALVVPGKGFEELNEGELTIDPAQPEDYRRLFQRLEDLPHALVHLWSLDIPALQAVPAGAGDRPDYGQSLDDSFLPGCGSVLHIIHAVREEYYDPPSLWLVTRGAQPVGTVPDVPGLAQSPLWGMARVIALEKPVLNCVRIDLDPEETGEEDRILLEEICSRSGTEDQVAFRGGTRHVARLAPYVPTPDEKPAAGEHSTVPSPFTLRRDAGYLITGGLGGLGLLVARWMVDKGARSLLLVGRNGPSEEAEGAINEMKRAGARVGVFLADVSRQDRVERIFAEFEDHLPPLRGIIHAAGLLDDGLIGQLNRERFERVLAPKVKGAWHLHALSAARGLHLDFFVFFSSIVAVTGNAGQAAYAAGSAFMDCLAHQRRALGLPGLSINWGGWSEVGTLARYPAAVEWIKETGIGTMSPRQGLDILHFLLSGDHTQVGVFEVDWARFTKRYRLKNAPFFDRLPIRQMST